MSVNNDTQAEASMTNVSSTTLVNPTQSTTPEAPTITPPDLTLAQCASIMGPRAFALAMQLSALRDADAPSSQIRSTTNKLGDAIEDEWARLHGKSVFWIRFCRSARACLGKKDSQLVRGFKLGMERVEEALRQERMEREVLETMVTLRVGRMEGV